MIISKLLNYLIAASLSVALSGERAVEGAGLTLALLSKVDTDGASAQVEVVHLLLGVGSRLVALKGNEAETTGAAGLAVVDDSGVGNGTELLESGTEIIGADLPRQVTDEELGRDGFSRHVG